MAIEAHALPVAMSMRNMLAPSWRWALLVCPEASSTTTAIGWWPASVERCSAKAMI